MKNNQYLPQYTLDQLSERVCIQLEGFKAVLNTKNMWDGITELCIKIENEPRAVNSVIAEAKQNHSQVLGSVYLYNTVLTRVYILLYYRHYDDTIYEDVVFSQLIKAMGYYSNNNPLKELIQPTIKNIIEQDKLVEKAREEQKNKEVKPVFAFEALSRPVMDRLFDEYSEELLFRNMSGVIKDLSVKYQTHLDEAEVWYNAKIVVHALRDLRRPELFIERVATGLVHGQIYHEYEGSQIILLCVYAMVRSAKDNTHFAKFISAMEKYGDELSNQTMLVLKKVKPIKKWLDEQQPFDDYDYIGETVMKELYTSDDMKRAFTEYQTRIQQLEKDFVDYKENTENTVIAPLKARIKELEEDDRLSADNSYLHERIEGGDGITTDIADIQRLAIDERIIFFSSALGVSLDPQYISQKKMSALISKLSGDNPESIRTRIVALNREEKKVIENKNICYSQSTKEAADNVYKYVASVSKSDSVRTNAMEHIMKNIDLVYDLNKENKN